MTARADTLNGFVRREIALTMAVAFQICPQRGPF